MDNQNEIFPVVDESGKVIGSATRGECHSGSKLLHPVVHLHVFNSKGEVYLQRRPEWKDIQPGKWDTAVGGHIDYGETPEMALRREVREELGITDFVPEPIDKYVFESKREKELVYVHRTTYDGEIRPSAEELDGGRFWSMQEIREAMGKDILTPNFESEFKRCFRKELGMKYALFFDIDGTLVSFKTHEIPPSTIFALTQAKANGHKVFIATGRPPLIITNLGAIEHLIDGYVTINGALCFVGDKEIRCKDIPKDDVQTVVQDAQEKSYGLIVIGERDVAVLDPNGEVDSIFRGELAVENLNQAKPLDLVLSQRILQLTAFFSADYESELMKRIPSCTSGRWHPAFTDITAKGADKGEGIKAMAKHLGLDPQNTISFGDGGNDTSMTKAAGIGIAMGNALESLKQEADYTTTSVDDDGVLNALRHFNLINKFCEMTLREAIEARHSVRAYKNQPLAEDVVKVLEEQIAILNREGQLHIQLILNEPKAFQGTLAKYGRFRNVTNYFVMAGNKADDLDERVGYYGEHLVLLAQTLGLNTCWVGLSYSKVPGTYVLEEGEKIACYIALGYGETQGVGHKIKTVEQVSNASDVTPSWFRKGVEAALLAPTAVNQQKFFFQYVSKAPQSAEHTLEHAGMKDNRHQVHAKRGFSMIGYTKMDLGIAKYHFEIGAGKEDDSEYQSSDGEYQSSFEWV